MIFNLKNCAAIAIIAAAPSLSFAQPTPQPAPTTRPPSTTAPMPQATVPAPPTGAQVATTQARRASQIIGANIVNDENRTVGEVHDLMIIPSGGAITAVLSVGGFLGLGERYVAVPLADLRWNADRSRWMLPGATVDSVRARPVFTYPERR